MARRCALLALIAVAVTGFACGKDESPPPQGCTDTRQALTALQRAPSAVRLTGGAALSECVSHATKDGDLQAIGVAFTAIADRLASDARASDDGALRMGYLVGATRRGAAHSNGVQAELVRRIEQATLLDEGAPASRRAAYDRGLRAGSARG